ncbi:hypothetical protein VCCP1035_2267B, partial [Vibrio cholerae CP1035(8)]
RASNVVNRAICGLAQSTGLQELRVISYCVSGLSPPTKNPAETLS